MSDYKKCAETRNEKRIKQQKMIDDAMDKWRRKWNVPQNNIPHEQRIKEEMGINFHSYRSNENDEMSQWFAQEVEKFRKEAQIDSWRIEIVWRCRDCKKQEQYKVIKECANGHHKWMKHICMVSTWYDSFLHKWDGNCSSKCGVCDE